MDDFKLGKVDSAHDDEVRSLKDIHTVAYVLQEANSDFEIQDIILDEVRHDELLIEMKFSGICHTDLFVQQGLMEAFEFPGILGHEGAGYVRAIGSNVKRNDIVVGDFVLLSINVCGQCKQCKRGHPAYCHEGGRLHMGAVRPSDGSSPARLKDGKSVRSQFFGQSTFSNMSVVQESCIAMKFPYDPEEAAKYVACGCGFQTGAGTVMNVLKPQSDDSIAIFGMGGVGLSALMAAKYVGAEKIIALDIVDDRFELARELGATHCINSRVTPDFVSEIRNITGAGADFAIDCVGNIAVIEGMIEGLAKCGTAVSVGIPPLGKKVSIDPLSHLFNNKRYIAVLEGDSVPQKFIPQLVEMQRSGKFPLERLCTTYARKEMRQALQDMHAGTVIKPVLQWS